MITKEKLEELLGFEVNCFTIQPTNENGINIYIMPKQLIETLDFSITVTPTGVEFDDEKKPPE